MINSGISNSDEIVDNWIDKFRYGINVYGSHDILIHSNVVTVRNIANAGSEVGIFVAFGTTGTITVSDTTLFGDAANSDLLILNGPFNNAGDNFCDPESAACALCVSSGNCNNPS